MTLKPRGKRGGNKRTGGKKNEKYAQVMNTEDVKDEKRTDMDQHKRDVKGCKDTSEVE